MKLDKVPYVQSYLFCIWLWCTHCSLWSICMIITRRSIFISLLFKFKVSCLDELGHLLLMLSTKDFTHYHVQLLSSLISVNLLVPCQKCHDVIEFSLRNHTLFFGMMYFLAQQFQSCLIMSNGVIDIVINGVYLSIQLFDTFCVIRNINCVMFSLCYTISYVWQSHSVTVVM